MNIQMFWESGYVYTDVHVTVNACNKFAVNM